MVALKPMLACAADLDKIKFPVGCSPKLDGIRAIIQNGKVLSRTLKPIPNTFIQSTLGKEEFNGFDGELIVGSAIAEDVYRVTNSAVMTVNEPIKDYWRYYVFDDLTNPHLPFKERLAGLVKRITALKAPLSLYLPFVPQRILNSKEEVYEELKVAERLGYEGIMLRDFESPYKFGRSTVKEGSLLKVKTFHDSEAVVIAIQEEMHNANELTKDERGYAERSTHKGNMQPTGRMGSLVVKDVKTGVEFSIGTGFNDEDREWWFSDLNTKIGLTLKYKYFPVGIKEKPRFPVYLGLRSRIDFD
jgi:DNA ligase 1